MGKASYRWVSRGMLSSQMMGDQCCQGTWMTALKHSCSRSYSPHSSSQVSRSLLSTKTHAGVFCRSFGDLVTFQHVHDEPSS